MGVNQTYRTQAQVDGQIEAKLNGAGYATKEELQQNSSNYFAGLANPSTDPGTPSNGTVWQVDTAGDYTNFPDSAVSTITVTPTDISNGKVELIFTPSTGYWKKAVTPPTDLAGYAKESETAPAVRKINNVTIDSVNLLPSDIAVSGFYFGFGNGNYTANASYYSILVPVKPSTTYSYIGFRAAFAGNEYNSSIDPNNLPDSIGANRTALIGDNVGLKTEIQFTTQSDTAYVGLNITSDGDIAYLSTMMLYEGVLGSETYQEYQTPVDPLKIKGGVASRAEIDSLTASQEAILSQFTITSFYRFNGTANAQLPIEYTLENIGDYVEWVGRDTKLVGDAASQSLGLIGRTAENDNTFGYYGTSGLRFRENNQSSAYIFFSIPIIVNIKNLNKFRLEINASDDWEVFVNDVSIGTTPRSDSFIVKNIANAIVGDMAKVDLISLTVSGTEGDLEITNFTSITNTNVSFVPEATFTGTLPPSPSVENYRECYITYDHSNGDGQPEFMIYIKIAPTFYVGYVLYNDYDMGSIYVDMFRIISASLFTFNGTAMTDTGTTILTGGESEAVFSEDGKSDFSGGYHGDETKQWVRFYLSNVEISPTADLPLTGGESFRYVQFSHVHETDDPTHSVIAHHYKETTFGSKGYLTKNKFIFQRTINIQTLYLGISTIAHANADTAMNEDFEFRTMNRSAGNGSTKYLEIDGGKTIEYTSPTTGLSATCFSEITDNPTWDLESAAFTKDNSQYAKYYRGTYNKIVNVSDQITGICRVTHNKI